MTRRAPILWLACIGLATAASDVQASRGERDDAPTAPFWQEVSRPGLKRSRDLLKQAFAHLEAASRKAPWGWETLCRRTLSIPLASDSRAARIGRTRALAELARRTLARQAHLDSALDRLDRALALDPDNALLLHTRARALSLWEQPGPVWSCRSVRRTAEALGAFDRLHEVDPAFRTTGVAFERALLLSHEQRFAEAAEAYERAIALALDAKETPVLRSNLAEMKMLSGALEEAVEHYERAIRLADDVRSRRLARWGLAVALDRLGEHERALEYVRMLVLDDEMRVLRSDGVFFEPDHEINYYEALGREALAEREERDRESELERARDAWRLFLDGAGPDGPFADTARRSLERVERALAE